MQNKHIEIKSIAIPVSEKTPPDGQYSVFHFEKPNEIDHNMWVKRGVWGIYNGDGFFFPQRGVLSFTHYIERKEMQIVDKKSDYNIDPDKYYSVNGNNNYVLGKDLRFIHNTLEFDKSFSVTFVEVDQYGTNGVPAFRIPIYEVLNSIKILSKFTLVETNWTPENCFTEDQLEEFKSHLKNKFYEFYSNLSKWEKFLYRFELLFYVVDMKEEFEKWRNK